MTALGHTTLWRAQGRGIRAWLRAAACAGIFACSAACAPASATVRAESLVRRHREADAVALLREDLAKHPDDVPAHKLLVRVLGFTGDVESARVEVAQL